MRNVLLPVRLVATLEASFGGAVTVAIAVARAGAVTVTGVGAPAVTGARATDPPGVTEAITETTRLLVRVEHVKCDTKWVITYNEQNRHQTSNIGIDKRITC